MDPHIYQAPLKLFQGGMDTSEIADYMGCDEATAYNLIYRAKEAERTGRGLHSSNYWRNGYTSTLRPYAGSER